ncbi:MAG: S1-like domain-containing RNA-binding protein [Myxococcota bacterium]
MKLTDLLGRSRTMWVRRRGPNGALLVTDPAAPADAATILLPNRDVPPDADSGTALKVFIYQDSEDRPTATVHAPRLTLGQVTFLECTDLTSFGAFFDWGLSKDLLVSKWEQTREVQVGDRHPIGLVLDDTGRLAGTMRVAEMLEGRPRRALGEWVDGEAWRNEPGLGLFVIFDRQYVGLVPASEPHALARGEAARFRICAIHPDGKVELSLRAVAHEQLADDGAVIVAALAVPNPPKLGDHSHPDEIRDRLGLSKKAFKRAVGRLLKEGRVRLDAAGVVTLVTPPRPPR